MKPAIVIPIYKPRPSHLESISLKQCYRLLGEFPIYLIGPNGIDFSAYMSLKNGVDVNIKVSTISFPEKFFLSPRQYNKLMLSKSFYETFTKYSHILIYQLDAFVFKKDLHYWLTQNYDYIGAPWQDGFHKANESSPFLGVGNGGFSLRNVQNHVKVLSKFRTKFFPKFYLDHFKTHSGGLVKFLYKIIFRNNPEYFIDDINQNEDWFWGALAPRYFNFFHVPTPEIAIAFSFEKSPRALFELNKRELPFGCHAWWRYDFEFWKPIIESQGYSIPQNINLSDH